MATIPKTALVTGGAQGLGLAIAERLLSDGAEAVVLADRQVDKGEEAAETLRNAGHDVSFVEVDMIDPASVRDMVAHAVARLGQVGALVNSAADCGRGDIFNTSPETYDRIMNINARGPFFAIQHFANAARAAGHGGGIVNILSIVSYGGLVHLAPYVMSKAALAVLTKNAAHALIPNKIRVNGINVGWMDTPGEDATQKAFHDADDDWLKAAEAATPFGQLVKPQEVAAQAALFLSPASGVVTGSIIDFDQRVMGMCEDGNYPVPE